MTRALSLLPLLAGAALLQAYAPAGRPLLQPIEPWVLDYGDSACTASRTYGSPAAPIVLALRPSPNGNVVRLTLIRPAEADSRTLQFPMTTNLTPKGTKLSALRFQSGDVNREIVWVNFERSALDRLPAAGEIELRRLGSAGDRFALPSIAAVLKGLDTCNADLRKYWNVGDAGVKLSKPATPLKPLAAYFSDSDYPDAAANENAGGTSRVMVMVDEKGIARDCLVEQTSGIATLDAKTCAILLKRARFSAALDPAGKPVRSVFAGRVIWRMPSAG